MGHLYCNFPYLIFINKGPNKCRRLCPILISGWLHPFIKEEIIRYDNCVAPNCGSICPQTHYSQSGLRSPAVLAPSSSLTHPHKKGPVMKNYTRHLTSFPMVIYQAEHNLWCPVNVGWENFAQLQNFQVK